MKDIKDEKWVENIINNSVTSLNSQDLLEAALRDLSGSAGKKRGNFGICTGEPISQSGKRKQLAKMLALTFLPIICLTGVAVYFLQDTVAALEEGQKVRTYVEFSTQLGMFLHYLQRERDQSVLYMSDIGPSTKSYLAARYPETDKSLEDLTGWPVNAKIILRNPEFRSKNVFRSYLNDHRNRLDLLNNTILEELLFYTSIIDVIGNWLTDSITESKYGTVWRSLVAYQKIIFVKENVGLERALGQVFFVRGHFESNEYYSLYNRALHTARNEFRMAQNFSPMVIPLTELDIEVKGNKLSMVLSNYREEIQWRNNSEPKGDLKRSAHWYDQMTIFVNKLLDVQLEIKDTISSMIESDLNARYISVAVSSIFILLVFAFCPLVIRSVVKLTTNIQCYAITLADKTKELNREKHRTDSLLYQMLPQPVADQLKSKTDVSAEYFKEVTVFFSDIVGFTRISMQCTPMEIVTILNTIYRLFDEHIGLFDVYKVETIGESYMVASGLPTRNGNKHASEIANMSLDLLNTCNDIEFSNLATFEGKIRLRIGVHTGPLVAGVVGSKLPRYCLFGDTVNTASRMETYSLPHRIHISHTTYRLLDKTGCYIMQRRGDIEVKGKGHMTTYWLIGNVSSPSHNTDDVSKSNSALDKTRRPVAEQTQTVLPKNPVYGITRPELHNETKPLEPHLQTLSVASGAPTQNPPSYADIEAIFEEERGSPTIVQLTEGVHY
ncbi:receptor-type guanylate cyclase daf-11 [Lingula anatina]|uniref:guanylate cyclase n=1 Tax=Lingula anatina TaxID=7574 RepID=A0A1S3I5I5_LINAN|nr:receptor-type guanylate cyclase daf-11 [Lingula anatina]|eukprot:XP_013393540.1 receptor-type guanylate cyclase daf-11 [Lingula anatina]